MALSRMHSVALLGLEAVPVEVEVDVCRSEKTMLVIVGLPDTAVRESKDRVLTAVRNSGYPISNIAATVNLAPGDLKKEGALYDLPIALGLLIAMQAIATEVHSQYLVFGELGLSGEMRPIQGALATAMLAKQMGKKGILLPVQNAKEAAVLPGIDVIPIHHLKEAAQFFQNPKSITPLVQSVDDALFASAISLVDFADIKGQVHAKRAVEIAAAGGHNVVLSGPPGSGKTMIAKAFLGILPPFTVEESLEVTRIYSVAGMLEEGKSLITQRPFRSPHHTVSYAGLIGGGTCPRPGEVSLAHGGILFLDELPEFSRSVLEVLRQPLEDRHVTISRAQGSFTFPSDFICIAAMNPCPCGYLGHPDKQCIDSPIQVDRYKNKISGPLWDRIDMRIDVPALRYQDLMRASAGESSAVIRARVQAARQFQTQRFSRPKYNAQMSAADIKRYCFLDDACQELMRQAVDTLHVSARGCARLTRVARTIADLDSSENIEEAHLMEAISYRQF